MTEYNIEDYGAQGDGRTLNTAAIQKTVDACAAAGGGRVTVPAGVFVSGPIHLRSNLEFHLGAGAIMRGSRDMTDYPVQDMETHGYRINAFLASLLTGFKLENVSITGKGVLDGQGDVWWKELDAGRESKRPTIIYLCDCERVLIDGVKVIDSPSWNILPLICRNVTIHDVSIKNPWQPYHNCDGIDLHSCSNVRISNCHVDTGDDGICLKSFPEWFVSSNGANTVDYSKPVIPCENVVIENCVVEHSHSGVGIWAEVIGGMSNIAVSNCVFDGTRTGIRINRYPWPGGYVKDVRVDNIVMRRVESVFEISSWHDPVKVVQGPGMENTPVFSNIHFSNITATKARFACEAYGLPGMPVRDISFSNIRIEADKGFDFRDAENIQLDNVVVTCPGPALLAENVRNLEVRRLVAAAPQAGIPAIQLTNVEDAWIHGCKAAAGTDIFLGLAGEGNRDIRLEANELSGAAQAQAQVKPAPVWSFTTCVSFTGTSMWRRSGNDNPFLPVTPAVMETIRREWAPDRIALINGVHRFENGARPDIALPAGDRRMIYVVQVRGVAEQLVICEDGRLLQKVNDPKFCAYRF